MCRFRPVMSLPPPPGASHPLRCGAGFDTLAIQAARRWVFVSSLFATHFGSEGIVELLPGAIVTPNSEIVVHTLPFRIFSGQHPPLDAPHDKVQNGIDDLSHIQTAGTSACFGRWDHWLDNSPLAIGHIGWVILFVHTSTLLALTDSRHF